MIANEEPNWGKDSPHGIGDTWLPTRGGDDGSFSGNQLHRLLDNTIKHLHLCSTYRHFAQKTRLEMLDEAYRLITLKSKLDEPTKF